IAAIHHATRDHAYPDATGSQLTLRRGALQLVFCDVSTPAGGGWNAYDELRRLLVDSGVAGDAIAYMQQAATDLAKAKLFAACRDGTIAVLIGSTETTGVGTNVQARAVALHHLDAPWRPADIEQRDGRILRQGNHNPEVQVIRYVTQGSFDTYMWQSLERKAAFIAQVTHGDLPDRDIDDIGDQALTYAEVKALATGDPLILEKAAVDADVARLTRLEHAHHEGQHRLRRTHDAARQRAQRAAHRIAQLQNARTRRSDTRGDRFAMIIDGTRHTTRADAGIHLIQLCATAMTRTQAGERHAPVEIVQLGGLTIVIDADPSVGDEIDLVVRDTGDSIRLTADELPHLEPTSPVTRLERRIQALDSRLEAADVEHRSVTGEARRAASRLGMPFEHGTSLAAQRRRQRELDAALLAAAADDTPNLRAGPAFAAVGVSTHLPSGEPNQRNHLVPTR
ncbi:MAG: hypothetical protein ACRD29_12970, partial [Acidimicrobiales bacterium]